MMTSMKISQHTFLFVFGLCIECLASLFIKATIALWYFDFFSIALFFSPFSLSPPPLALCVNGKVRSSTHSRVLDVTLLLLFLQGRMLISPHWSLWATRWMGWWPRYSSRRICIQNPPSMTLFFRLWHSFAEIQHVLLTSFENSLRLVVFLSL